ncbi:MAG: pyridoxamine 5'-phosphate oxidase family protein [Spirochaetaceae bacterium]|jgi:hypothetical protein|nr:pyridoxamine 5'-phosphate oxidase family protein [Spirochaetaceae bacterium]
MIRFNREFEDSCREKFESDSKIGLLASIAPDGYPHVALISSIGVKSKTSLMWGQFSQGLSKTYLKDNPNTGFLVVSPDQYWWTGKARHSGIAVKGEDFDYFNNKPLFRYNSYCGFGAVHYGDLVDVSAGEKLPLLKVALGALKSGGLKKQVLSGKYRPAPLSSAPAAADGPEAGEPGGPEDLIRQKMPPYGIALGQALTGLKFAAYVDTDGYPRIIPALQGKPADGNTLIFSPLPYGELLRQIPSGRKAAVYMANLDLESLLLQGRWFNLEQRGSFKGSVFEIDKVYNSMLPIGGYIYPPKTLPNVYGKV